jgi:hypothetical protein
MIRVSSKVVPPPLAAQTWQCRQRELSLVAFVSDGRLQAAHFAQQLVGPREVLTHRSECAACEPAQKPAQCSKTEQKRTKAKGEERRTRERRGVASSTVV